MLKKVIADIARKSKSLDFIQVSQTQIPPKVPTKVQLIVVEAKESCIEV